MKRARINGTVMPIVFDGANIVIALDPSVSKKDQRTEFSKSGNSIVEVKAVKYGITKPKRQRIKQSPFINN